MAAKPYDPVKRAEELTAIICRDDGRRYHRFRTARFYGGIATADCIGCCLRCLFCWSWHQVVSPDSYGQFYSPREVASNLVRLARQKHLHLLRISGNEPTLAREHLLRVLERIPPDLGFILETNGILLGHDRTYAEELTRFENLYVRVSLKGTNEDEFTTLTGAEPSGFSLQMRALEHLSHLGVRAHPAVMVSFSSQNGIQALRRRLGAIEPSFTDFEVEELALWGDVGRRLRKAGIRAGCAFHPRATPPDQV